MSTVEDVPNIKRARTGLAIYFVVLLVLTGVAQFLIIHTGEPLAEHIGLVYLLMWSPAAASFVARIALREGIRDVSFRLKGAWKSLLLAWLMPVIVGLAGYGIAWLTGLAAFNSTIILHQPRSRTYHRDDLRDDDCCR